MTHELLRFATAGSVDDGKSTLVGRLLHDSKSVLADQLAAIERVSNERGMESADLALLTDGLRAEREQGITIDVAYRYFSTAKRSFILADTPGHVQYTRNMVTGASTTELALILIDVRHGVVEQTRRHAAIAALLGVRHIAVVVNKMDLVDYSQEKFNEVSASFTDVASSLGLVDTTVIPVSALVGDNVVDASDTMPWYTGPTLLDYLETVPVGTDPRDEPFRLPVQYVNRPRTAKYPDFRGFSGRIASGVVRVGDDIVVSPLGSKSTVTGIEVLGTP
ncbi:MAG: GTP-binding protein, partial [Candidatus Nanopelagicales bacterium]